MKLTGTMNHKNEEQRVLTKRDTMLLVCKLSETAASVRFTMWSGLSPDRTPGP